MGAMAANFDEEVPMMEGEGTRRLALLDMDWEHVRAVDILMVLRSFLVEVWATLHLQPTTLVLQASDLNILIVLRSFLDVVRATFHPAAHTAQLPGSKCPHRQPAVQGQAGPSAVGTWAWLRHLSCPFATLTTCFEGMLPCSKARAQLVVDSMPDFHLPRAGQDSLPD